MTGPGAEGGGAVRKRPTGVFKRPPSYVPAGAATKHLMSFSKADLAELVWDYAKRIAGESVDEAIVIQELLRTASYLDAYHGRRTPSARTPAPGL